MPELPEVETIRRALERELVGRRILRAELLTPKILSGVEGWSLADVVGATFVAARRRAKYLILDLSNDLTLVIHLSLAGQIVLVGHHGGRTSGGHPVPAYDQPLPHKQTHVIIDLDDGSVFSHTLTGNLVYVVAQYEYTAVDDELKNRVYGARFAHGTGAIRTRMTRQRLCPAWSACGSTHRAA